MRMQQNNPPYIRLANRLVRAVGFQSAVKACHENHWHGVLQHLAKNKPYYLSEYGVCGTRQ